MKMSKIVLNNMEFYGYHGVPDAERKVKQLFKISLSFDYDFTNAAVNDDLDQTINYVEIYDICKLELNKQYKLIESIAYKIAHSIKNKYQKISNIEVIINKPQVQMKGKLENVGVVYYL